MFKSSITKFLIASLGILMIGLFVAALILAVEAWTNYVLAGSIGVALISAVLPIGLLRRVQPALILRGE